MKLSKLLKVLLGLVVVLVVAVVCVFFFINSIVKTGIEAGGKYALGVPTTVNSVSVGLGSFGMNGLNVANPTGFNSPHFLELGDANVAVTLPSLMQDTIQVPTFSLDNLDVNLEKKNGATNYKVILDNLSKLKGDSKATQSQSADQGGGKKLVISDVSLKNIKVHVNLLGDGGTVSDITKVNINLDEIKLQNVGKTDKGMTGVTVSQLSSIIVQAVLSAVADKGGGILPADLLGDLGGQLSAIGDIKDLGLNVVGKVGSTVENAGKQVIDGAAKGVGDAADKLQKDVGKGLKDLLPGKK